MQDEEKIVSEEVLPNDPELVEEEAAEVVEEGSKKEEKKTPKVKVDHEDEEDEGDKDEDEDEDDEEKEVEEESAYKEDLDELCDQTDGLTERFKEESKIIFEAAFTKRLREATEKLESDYEIRLAEETDAVRENLTEKVDEYLSFVSEEWVKENEVAIDNGLRTELTEDFMSALKTVFSENYIEVPESKLDLYAEVEAKAIDLEEKLQDHADANGKLQKEVEVLSREKIIAEASEDLATTQSVKLASLVEDIEFVDTDTFAKKVGVIRESYFSGKETGEGEADVDKSFEQIVETKEIVDGRFDAETKVPNAMLAYTDAFKRITK
jgi:hypothetical protein